MAKTKPFLILQLRPEDEASDNELEAFIKFGGIEPGSARRIRMEQGSLPDINLDEYAGLIVGGGPYNVSDPDDKKSPEQKKLESWLFPLIQKIIDADFPYLGACYGLGALSKVLGGEVSKERYSEAVEAITINLTDAAKDDALISGLPTSFRAFAGHKESCQNLPPGATLLASSETCPVHMIRIKQNIYATQFHTELEQVGLALRINIYRHAGYFPPEDAESLIAAAEKEKILIPPTILSRFVARYK